MHIKTYYNAFKIKYESGSKCSTGFNMKNGYKDGNDFQYNVNELQA